MGIFNNPLTNNFFKLNEIVEKKLNFLHRDENRFSIFETEKIDVPESESIFDLDVNDVPYSYVEGNENDMFFFDYEDVDNQNMTEFEYFKQEQEYNKIVGSLQDISNISVVETDDNFISIDGTENLANSRNEDKTQLQELANKSTSSLAPSPQNTKNYDKTVWKTVTPVASGSGKNKKYVYHLKGGATIQVASTKGVQILQNKNTDEIVVIGVQNAKIDDDQNDTNITIYNSTIKDLDMGMGDDKITIKNSTVGNIDGASGVDVINIDNCKVTGKIDGGKGDDYIIVQNSTVNQVNGQNGNDNFLIKNSTVQNLLGGNGDDLFVIEKSTVKKLDGGKGTNILDKSGSTINSNSNNKNIKKVSSISSTNTSKEVKELSGDFLDDIVSKYINNPSKATEKQKMQALALNEFAEQLEQMEEQFKNRNDEDGLVSTGYNMIKVLLKAGVSKKEIETAIAEQKQMVKELKNALNGKGDLSFEEVYKKWTGVDYNAKNIQEHIQVQAQYDFALSSLSSAQKMSNDIKDAKNLKEVFNIFVEKYGDKETARKEMNKLLAKFTDPKNAIWVALGRPTEMYIDKDFNLVSNSSGKKQVRKMSKVSNIVGAYSEKDQLDLDNYLAQKEAKQIEKTLGVSVGDLANQLKSTELKALGYGNSLQKVLDKYCQDQEDFPKNLSLALTAAGIICSGIGSIGSIAGLSSTAFTSFSSLGSALTKMSSFSTDVLSLLDELSSKKGVSRDEALDYVKNAVKSIAQKLITSGGSNISQTAKNALLKQFQKDVLPILKEMGTDSVLSILAELSFNGEVDLSAIGISEMLTLITGLAGIKNK